MKKLSVLERIKKGTTVGFMGLGISNESLLRTLPLENCDVILRSDNVVDRHLLPKKVRNVKTLDGTRASSCISEEILFLSPSVRRDKSEICVAKERGVILSSDTELFCEELRAPLLSITGSDGKSTTTTLTAKLLNASGKRALAVGNIGVPMFASLGDGSDIYIAELSSFMLQYCTPKSKRAAITNLTPNHLNWHKDFEEYKEAKLSLLSQADERVISIECEVFDEIYERYPPFAICSTHHGYEELKSRYRAKVYLTYDGGYVRKNGKVLFGTERLIRRELHNIQNLLTAIAMTDGYTDEVDIKRVAEGFVGLAHRCERVCNRNGVEYFDSSIDSTPARAARTLSSFEKNTIILLGGRGKGVAYDALIPVLKSHAKTAITFGEDGEKIYKLISSHMSAEFCGNFHDAVERAIEISRKGDKVLLSPAATSYDEFQNYEERGNEFKKIISNYYKNADKSK